MAESRLVREIMLALSAAGCTVWRQNTGVGWAGRTVWRQNTGVGWDGYAEMDGDCDRPGDAGQAVYAERAGSSMLIGSARPLRAGLCVGSGDIIGIAPDGRFLSVEVKSRRGRPTSAQITFRDAVLRAGGIAGIVWSVPEALALIRD